MPNQLEAHQKNKNKETFFSSRGFIQEKKVNKDCFLTAWILVLFIFSDTDWVQTDKRLELVFMRILYVYYIYNFPTVLIMKCLHNRSLSILNVFMCACNHILCRIFCFLSLFFLLCQVVCIVDCRITGLTAGRSRALPTARHHGYQACNKISAQQSPPCWSLCLHFCQYYVSV